ncbi:MAG: hypothetical protein RSE93_07945, partial [Oscillospiraceae bacterium]
EIARATEETENGETLLSFMLKTDPKFASKIESIKHGLLTHKKYITNHGKEENEASDTDASGYIKNQSKKADNRPKTGKLSTFIGGGEGN